MPRYIVAAFFLFNAALSQADDTRFGDSYVPSVLADATTLLPIMASDQVSHLVIGNLFNGLLKYNPKIELEGDLAESWEVLDEGKAILFHLKPHIFWHDGQPLTARDIEFTYQTLINPEVPSPYKGDFLGIESLEVLDELTVRIKYKEALSPALSSWTIWIIPKHLLEREDFLKTDFARHPIGSGPYKFKRWKTGEFIEVIANQNYFEGRPNLDRIIYRIIPDQTTTFLELHQQSIDSMSLTPLQFKKQTNSKYFDDTFAKYKYPSFGYTYLGFNLERPLFKQGRIRQAIDMAIDKEEIIEAVLMGYGRPLTGPFSPESWAYNPLITPRAHDVKAATAILKQMGWMDTDNDGIIDKDGQAFEFTIVTSQGNFQRKLTAEIIQRRLKDIGIDVKIKILEWSAFISNCVDKHDFDAVLLGWGLSRDPDPNDIWHSSKTGPGEFNFIFYNNPEVDELIGVGRREFDIAKRQAAYYRIHELIHIDSPYIFLYVGDALPIIHKRFSNIEQTPIGLAYNFNDWYVEQDKRRYTRFELNS